ncbi:type III polyketide synthase [Streptomyces sp. NPDC127068]|uniref:type III polyketide synthase n=1 Tax=Streptomyces sp. NPDC127068 TaxID=3347127 RepID=UPI0036646035
MATGGRIRGIRAEFPPGIVSQDDAFEGHYARAFHRVPDAEGVFASTQVRRRHMAWDPRSDGVPTLGERMRAWEGYALDLGGRALGALLADSDPARIGSLVLASCTGYTAPSPDVLWARTFGFRRDLRRTFVGHMGCNAAFNALKVALDALDARPEDQALVVCVEFCSLHLTRSRPVIDKEQLIVHALFGDAVVAVLLAAPDKGTGPTVLRTHTETHCQLSDAMTWRVQDPVFHLSLSPAVPLHLSQAIGPFVERLLAPAGLRPQDIRHWGIHPGGPKIIEFIGRRLHLDEEQLTPSRRVLREYGNCSSATILLILDQIMRHSTPEPGEYGVLMAFGPGLSMESALIRF